MKITISKPYHKFPYKNRNLLLCIVQKISSITGLSSVAPQSSILEIILVDDLKMTEINESFLKHQGSTDVITFNYLDTVEDDETVAELYISLDTAHKSAREYSTSFSEEVILYIIHGNLHLMGFDDHSESDIKKMRQAEVMVKKKLKKIFSDMEIFANKELCV